MIYTLGYSRTESEEQGRFLRKARYFGPTDGPYTLYGAVWLEDYLLPLPLSVTLARIVELIQAHRAKAERDAQTAKVGVVTGSKAAQEKITGGKNNSVWHIPGADKNNTFPMPVGGPQEATERHLARLEVEFQLAGGQSLALSGSPDSGTTATSDALAAQQAAKQEMFARHNFITSVASDLKGWIWFYHEAPEINFNVTISDPLSGEMMTMPYRGVYNGRIDVPLSSIELDIDPYSVGFVTPEEAAAQGAKVNEQIVGILAAGRAYPELEVENLLSDQLDRSMTRGDWQRYVNPAILRMIREQSLMGAVMPMGGGMGAGADQTQQDTQLLKTSNARPPAAGANPGRSAGAQAGGAIRGGRDPGGAVGAQPKGAMA